MVPVSPPTDFIFDFQDLRLTPALGGEKPFSAQSAYRFSALSAAARRLAIVQQG